MGFRIELDHTGELGLNAFNQLSVKTVGANDNTFSIEEDGLYVSARPGADGTGGTGYEGTYTDEGIRLGYQNPFNDNTAPRRFTLMHYVHRLYDSANDSGSSLVNFRSDVDYVLVGDMYRVNQNNGTWKYFLVTETQASGTTTSIVNSVQLGVW